MYNSGVKKGTVGVEEVFAAVTLILSTGHKLCTAIRSAVAKTHTQREKADEIWARVSMLGGLAHGTVLHCQHSIHHDLLLCCWRG